MNVKFVLFINLLTFICFFKVQKICLKRLQKKKENDRIRV